MTDWPFVQEESDQNRSPDTMRELEAAQDAAFPSPDHLPHRPHPAHPSHSGSSSRFSEGSQHQSGLDLDSTNASFFGAIAEDAHSSQLHAIPNSIQASVDPIAVAELTRRRRALVFLGIGDEASAARKAYTTFVFDLSWGFCQMVVIVTMLVLTGTIYKSPKQPDISEWKACNRPLGIWCCIWLLRVCLIAYLSHATFVWNRAAQSGDVNLEDGQGHLPNSSENGASHNAQSSTRNSRHQPNGRIPRPPPTGLHTRLTTISSLLTLTWFITVQILTYTSLNSCQKTSPHLWWLTFGILCIIYLMILEVVVLGFVVVVIAPIVFIFWNIFLICIGRHPLQNPDIAPEIGKLSNSIVNTIPLVMYIPPPPKSPSGILPIVPDPALSYPPKIRCSPHKTRPRFRFLRTFSSPTSRKCCRVKGNDSDPSNEKESSEDSTFWEAHWERNEFPFVVLEENRAACAICLMDFEEPKRKDVTTTVSMKVAGKQVEDLNSGETTPTAPATISPVPLTPRTEEAHRSLHLVDMGEGAQPLRLLACGHVFHKTCLDPWLVDVSGRCPVCQQAVKLPNMPTKWKRGHTRRL